MVNLVNKKLFTIFIPKYLLELATKTKCWSYIEYTTAKMGVHAVNRKLIIGFCEKLLRG